MLNNQEHLARIGVAEATSVALECGIERMAWAQALYEMACELNKAECVHMAEQIARGKGVDK